MTTICLCTQELEKYFTAMTGCAPSITLSAGTPSEDFYEEYTIDVDGGKGSITANRPRALLLGVYDFLRRCGCRFIRPGKGGEVIPKINAKDVNVHAHVVPANRHRGITIEGAVSLENVLDIVEWAPKAGFNSYFIQFRNAYEFFHRWYSHVSNDSLPPESFSEEDSRRFVERIVQKIHERDMIYHAVGHGWTSACVGVDSNSWKSSDFTLSEENRQLLAEINGERKFFKGVPLNTNLCYSNPKAREKMVSEVVSYALAHPETDVLHFWLADDSNNVCECDSCAKKGFSDWYVEMLNDIDERLTALNVSTKICFLVYLDLYWPPKTERIKNQSRFIMMFAPIFRSYRVPFDCEGRGEYIEYKRNRVVYPTTTPPYLNFLREWKEIFHGDTFDFDYHLMWDINRDFGGETLAEVLFKDIRALPALGLNGFMSCQLQRAFYPNGFAFYLMGRALFDGNLTFDEIREEYYSAAFGEYKDFASRLYREIEDTVSFAYMKDEASDSAALPGFVKAETLLTKALAEFPDNVGSATVRDSLAILRFTVENVLRLVRVLVLKIEKAPADEIARADEERVKFYNDNELRFQPFTDGFYVNLIVGGIVKSKCVGIYAD